MLIFKMLADCKASNVDSSPFVLGEFGKFCAPKFAFTVEMVALTAPPLPGDVGKYVMGENLRSEI